MNGMHVIVIAHAIGFARTPVLPARGIGMMRGVLEVAPRNGAE
jgi:hypothetical protein